MMYRYIFLLLMLFVFAGCGESVPAPVATDIINTIKANFQRYEKENPLSGSEEMALGSLIEKLKDYDSAKAEIAEKALNDCKALNGKVAEQKKVAEAVIQQL